MKVIGKQMVVGALALVVSVAPVTPIGAQVTSSPAGVAGARALAESNQALVAQRAAAAESILAAKEQARGEAFDGSVRAGLKSRMETLSLEQLASLAQQGADADIPLALGSVTSDLVYTPVTPCRVFDSRVSAGGPGPIAANTQRNVYVVGTLNFPTQGGVAGGCGVPVGATSAIINFVTVLPAGAGDIRAWAVTPGPAAQLPAPTAAVINYGTVAGLPAIANGVAVPLCNPAAGTCTVGDLRLQADTNSTDILGDVVGYFGAAGPTTLQKRSTFAFANVPAAGGGSGQLSSLTFTSPVTGTAVLTGRGWCNVASGSPSEIQLGIGATLATAFNGGVQEWGVIRLSGGLPAGTWALEGVAQTAVAVTANTPATYVLAGRHATGAIADNCSGSFQVLVFANSLP